MLDPDLVAEVLHTAQGGGANWAELFVEDTVRTNLLMLNGAVKDANSGNDFGVGVRVLYGTKVVYAYTNDCSSAGLLGLADAVARAEGTSGEPDARGRGGLDFRVLEPKLTWPIEQHPFSVSKRGKLELIRRATAAAQVGQVKTVDARRRIVHAYSRLNLLERLL